MHRVGALAGVGDGIDDDLHVLADALAGFARQGREVAHFVGDDCEAAPRLTGARRFDGGIEREQVRGNIEAFIALALNLDAGRYPSLPKFIEALRSLQQDAQTDAPDEADIDAVTAVSGSGPAYVFYFIEALEQSARALGMSAQAARQLAIGTFTGAAKLAAQSTEDIATLRARVTSKGGTTERALASMENDHIKTAIERAVKAAADRSRELGDELGRG